MVLTSQRAYRWLGRDQFLVWDRWVLAWLHQWVVLVCRQWVVLECHQWVVLVCRQWVVLACRQWDPAWHRRWLVLMVQKAWVVHNHVPNVVGLAQAAVDPTATFLDGTPWA